MRKIALYTTEPSTSSAVLEPASYSLRLKEEKPPAAAAGSLRLAPFSLGGATASESAEVERDDGEAASVGRSDDVGLSMHFVDALIR